MPILISVERQSMTHLTLVCLFIIVLSLSIESIEIKNKVTQINVKILFLISVSPLTSVYM